MQALKEADTNLVQFQTVSTNSLYSKEWKDGKGLISQNILMCMGNIKVNLVQKIQHKE